MHVHSACAPIQHSFAISGKAGVSQSESELQLQPTEAEESQPQLQLQKRSCNQQKQN